MIQAAGDEITAEDIESLAVESGEELFAELAENGNNGFNQTDFSGGYNASRGDVGSLDLRNIGTGNTVTLLYGRRLVLNPTKYEGNGVDEKLLRISEDMAGTLITADYNLSQIAEVKELKVMNLSDLVIALRPEVQPGESLNIKIVREGKEKMQGIGYLDDGTMVVIDEAKNFVGSRLDIVITGALQTPTGRMVFGKLINNPESNKSFKSPATQG